MNPVYISHMQCRVCETGVARHFEQVDSLDYWRCGACEATLLDASQLPARPDEHTQYRLHRNEVDDEGYRQFLSRLAEPLLECLPPGQQGLDYGCGPGPALAAMLCEAGHDVALYDPLFFPDDETLTRSYDFITCSEVVEHFHEPAEEFRKLNQRLRPGGWLAVMTTFQTDDAAFRNWHYRRDPTHVVFYRLETFEFIARQHGWQCSSPCRNVVLLRKPA